MTGRHDLASYQESVDQLFQSGEDSPPATPDPEVSPLPPVDVATAPLPPEPTPPSPTPELVPAWMQMTDWQAELQWIQEERKRLEAYTAHQFALVKQQREDLLGRRSGIEETLALREQELNRKLNLLAESGAALEQRNRELAERETTLAQQQQKLDSAREELQFLQETNTRLQKDNEAQRLLAEQLRIQTVQLQESARAARSEVTFLDQSLARRRKAAEEERIEVASSRLQLDQRHAALEKAEDSLRRRVAEIDQLEAQIRLELEQREHQLALEAQELEGARASLRSQLQKGPEGDTPAPHRGQPPRRSALSARH